MENPTFRAAVALRRPFHLLGPARQPGAWAAEPVSAVQALAFGLPAAYVQGYGNPAAAYDYNDLSAFVQDEWQIGRRVTIRPGLRYQKQFWPDARYDVSNARRQALRVPLAAGRQQPGSAAGGRHRSDRRRPDLDSMRRTACYYDHHITGNVAATQIVNGRTGVRTLAARFPASIAAWTRPGSSASRARDGVPERRDCDRSRTANTVRAAHRGRCRAEVRPRPVTFRPISSRCAAHHQLGTIDFNPIVPALGPGRRPNDVDNRAGTSASILQYTSFGETWYDGLTLSVSKRLSGRSQFLASYTLSKAEDTSTDFQSVFMPERSGAGRNPADPTGLPLGFDPTRERGPSAQDQRHRVVLSGLHELPFDMQFSAVATAASGRPFTALAGADLNGDGDGGAFPPDRARRNPADPDSRAWEGTLKPCRRRSRSTCG